MTDNEILIDWLVGQKECSHEEYKAHYELLKKKVTWWITNRKVKLRGNEYELIFMQNANSLFLLEMKSQSGSRYFTSSKDRKKFKVEEYFNG